MDVHYFGFNSFRASKGPALRGNKDVMSVRKKKKYDFAAILKANELFGALGEATLEKLSAVIRIVPLARGQILFSEGDSSNGCYCIVSGAVKVSLFSEDGDETLLAVLGKGDIIGEMALVDRLPRSATVTALKDSVLGIIGTQEFERLADANTDIYRQMLCVLSGRIRAANDQKASQQKPLNARIAQVFLKLSEGFGEKLPDGRIMIRQKFSQAQLGQMAGCARENVNRQLTVWRRDKLVSQLNRYYCLDDIKAMRREARV